MLGRKFIFYYFSSCILMETPEVSVNTASRQLGLCKAEDIPKKVIGFWPDFLKVDAGPHIGAF